VPGRAMWQAPSLSMGPRQAHWLAIRKHACAQQSWPPYNFFAVERLADEYVGQVRKIKPVACIVIIRTGVSVTLLHPQDDITSKET